MSDFKLTVPHDDSPGRHEWFFPNGWRGVGPIERRDAAGRAQGNRRGNFPEWFVLMCNNPGCPGRSVVPVSLITDVADVADPAVTPRGSR